MKYSLPTLLTLALLSACSSSSSNPVPDGGDFDGASQQDSGAGEGGTSEDGGDAGDDGGDEDSGGEEAGTNEGGTGDGGDAGEEIDGEGVCADEAIECGEVTLSNGIVLDCGGPNPDGVEKRCEPQQTCVENQCTCESELLLPEGERPECGTANDCSDSGVELGSCSDPEQYPGSNWTCTAARMCDCVATPKSTACGGRACGTAVNGCGETYDCGTACGQGRACVATGGGATCECDASFDTTTFCQGKCGAQTLNGCPVDCGNEGSCNDCASSGADCTSCTCIGGEICGDGSVCCSPVDEATLCAGKACGETVTDPCTGNDVVCGCGAGEGCADARYLRDSALSACVPEAVAHFLGKYAVRTHNFTEGGGDVTRSEVISLVTVTADSSGANVQIQDEGCIATTDDGDSGAGRMQVLTLAYSYLPDEYHGIEIDGTQWTRHFARNASPAKSPVPTGWIADMPSYCPGAAPGDTDDGPGPGNGSSKPWLAGACTCPDEASVCEASDLDPDPANDTAGDTVSTRFSACAPEQNLTASASGVTDCRINDVDQNGRPGLSLRVEGGVFDGMNVDVLTVADIQWQGQIDALGSHWAYATEPEDVLRRVVSCDGGSLPCSGVASSAAASCGEEYNLIRFTRLQGDELDYECSDFYVAAVRDGDDAAAESLSDIRTGVYRPLFTERGVRCAGNGPCPCSSNAGCASRPHTICHDDDPGTAGVQGHCWPQDSPGACAGEGTCPSGWQCRNVDQACWPDFSTSIFGTDSCTP